MELRRSCPQAQRPIGQQKKGSQTFLMSNTTGILCDTPVCPKKSYLGRLYTTIIYVSTAYVTRKSMDAESLPPAFLLPLTSIIVH